MGMHDTAMQLFAERRGMMSQNQNGARAGYSVSDEEQYVTVSFAPDMQITIELLLEAIDVEVQITGDSGKGNLWDMRDCRIDRNVNFLTLREAVLHIKDIRDGKITSGKTAILVNSTIVYGVARTFQSIADIKDIGFDIAVFDDKELAVSWLGDPAITAEKPFWLAGCYFNC